MPTGSQAYIKLLAKKGKDPTLPGSYWPISMLNLDAKILSKTIDSCLAPLLHSFIHPAQAGLVTESSATSNIRKVLAALEYAKSHPAEHLVIITLDPVKAFDNVNFNGLFMVLLKFGFVERVLDFLQNMYSIVQDYLLRRHLK